MDTDMVSSLVSELENLALKLTYIANNLKFKYSSDERQEMINESITCFRSSYALRKYLEVLLDE